MEAARPNAAAGSKPTEMTSGRPSTRQKADKPGAAPSKPSWTALVAMKNQAEVPGVIALTKFRWRASSHHA
jgi:hypothetical protein